MEIQLFTEANKIWQQITSDGPREQLQLEIDLYKKLLNYFQAGDYFYWIFDLQSQSFEVVSDEVTKVLGYEKAEFSLEKILSLVHPDDRPYVLNFENKALEFLPTLAIDKLMKFKVRYDFRVMAKDGRYVRLLHQSIIIQHDEKGQVIRTLCFETDITHIKPEGKPTLSIIGLEGEPSYINVDVENIFAVSKEILSKREKQILLLIMEGKLSKEISEILHISKQTVDTHRNNMLAKCAAANSSELIVKAIRQGWV
jgi:DNA-binding CsgD family transcriptional regulator